MLSIEKLRQIEPALAELPDEEVEVIRDALYDAAGMAYELWREKSGSKCPIGSFPSGREVDTL